MKGTLPRPSRYIKDSSLGPRVTKAIRGLFFGCRDQIFILKRLITAAQLGRTSEGKNGMGKAACMVVKFYSISTNAGFNPFSKSHLLNIQEQNWINLY